MLFLQYLYNIPTFLKKFFRILVELNDVQGVDNWSKFLSEEEFKLSQIAIVPASKPYWCIKCYQSVTIYQVDNVQP